MAALVKYADSDSTKDPESDEEKVGKGKKNDNTKGQHNTAGQGNHGKHKADNNSDFVANTNAQNNNQRLKGKASTPRFGGPKFNLEAMMNQPCPKHGTQDKPASHLWKDCFIMREYRNSSFFQNNHGPNGGSGSGSHGPGFWGGGSSSGFQGQGSQGGFNQQSVQGNQ